MRRRQRLEGRGRQPRSTCSPGSWRRQDSAAHALIPDSALPNREGTLLGFEASKFATVCYSSPGEKEQILVVLVAVTLENSLAVSMVVQGLRICLPRAHGFDP